MKKPSIFDFLKVHGFLSQNPTDETSIHGIHNMRFRNRTIRDAVEEYKRLMMLAHSGIIEPTPLERFAIHVLSAHAEHVSGKGILKLMNEQAGIVTNVKKPEKAAAV